MRPVDASRSYDSYTTRSSRNTNSSYTPYTSRTSRRTSDASALRERRSTQTSRSEYRNNTQRSSEYETDYSRARTTARTTQRAQRRNEPPSEQNTTQRAQRRNEPQSEQNTTQRRTQTYVSRRVGDIRNEERALRQRKAQRKMTLRLISIIAAVVLLFGGGLALYVSPVCTIEKVRVEGADHLTQEEMLTLAAVPSGTTLLRVDTAQIEKNCLRDAWIEKVRVSREFPSTLVISVTEREIAAVVEVPSEVNYTSRLWAIAADKMWLMPIPDQDSEQGQAINPQIYEDVESVLRITDVPFGAKVEIGTYCTDVNINNALSVVAGMTTQLKDRVVKVSATDSESTTLVLDNGIEIAFGTAENTREKERIILALLEEHEGNIAYINVRSVNNPTWRAVS